MAGRPQLVASVTDHVAGVGRLERLDLGAHPAPPDDVSSAQEAAWWRDHLGPVIAEAAAALGSRTVLLVVDRSSSGWPLTVAAAQLRQAGASRVLPLLLHRTV